jgi:bla regulator protein BlaR1
MTRALFDHLWQSTLFCAALWSITLAMRANAAAVRHWLWQLASLKFLVPFSVLHLLGAAAGLPTPVESQPTLIVAALDAATPVISPATSLGNAASAAAIGLLPALLAAWILGSAWIALRWLRSWRSAVLLSRVARPAPGASPDAYVTDADIEPSVARVFRPVVLLPAALLGRLTGREFDAVLAHEREHIARHDNLKAHAHHLVETLFWFHPLVWLIGRHLREERELACDEAVIASGHDPGDYAAGILTVCRHCAGVHSKHAVAALAGDLTQRIRQILDGTSPLSVGFVKAFALSTGTLLLAIAPLFAGALDDAARRRVEVERHARALWDAQFDITPAHDDGGMHARLSIAGRELSIRNSSLRELVALAYGVESRLISGRGDWLDGDRYDVRVTLHEDMRDPETFSPLALRTSVNKLLATRFNIEIHVNQQCQYPCGWRALEASDATR